MPNCYLPRGKDAEEVISRGREFLLFLLFLSFKIKVLYPYFRLFYSSIDKVCSFFFVQENLKATNLNMQNYLELFIRELKSRATQEN